MAGYHHSPAAASGNPQSHQNDVTPASHNQQSGTIHRRRNSRKIQTLINAVNFIPFTPKLLILNKQENVLKRLGLYNFSKIKLDQNIRSDLIAQVIANYDPKKRCSFVNGKRVCVNRADLARALELPVGKQDINDNDLGVFSDEDIEFVDDFVFNWMLIHEESWAMPEKIVRMTRCVRDGHPEKLDSASLIWYKVEKELGLGVKLVDCYYASHLQWLVRSQCEQLFEVDEDDGECIEKVSDVELTFAPDVELTLRHETVGELVDSKNNAGEQLLQHCQTSDLNNNEVKVEQDEDDGEHVERLSIVQEDNAELTLGHVTVEEQVGLNDNLGEQLLQRCQFSDLNNNEKVKVEDVVDEQIVEVEDNEVKEDEDDGEHLKKVSIVQEGDAELTLGDVTMDDQVDLTNNLCEQLMQRCQPCDLSNNEVKVEDIVDEQIVEVEDDDEVKEDEDDGEHIKKVSIVQEDNAELTLGDVTMDDQVGLNDNLGEQLLQRSQSELNNNEVKVEDVVDEQIVEVEDDEVKEDVNDGECIEKVSIVQEDNVQLTLAHNVELNLGDQTVDKLVDSKNNSGEQLLQHGQTSDLNNNEVKAEDVVDKQIVEVEVVNDDDGEKFVEGLDMEANDDSVDLVESRDDSFMPHGGPSFFDNNNTNNNGKRVMESEENTPHPDMNNKRLRTIDIWDHNQSEFGQCMVQMDQWIEKAKMITDSKQQIYVNHKYHQDSAMHELQDRQQVMEMIIKSKDEALEKKHTEVYRLEHELYLMHDLLSGYIKALNDEHIKFSEYRKRVGVQEKHALKDVGPSGMVSSTQELEEVVSNDANVSEEKGDGEEH